MRAPAALVAVPLLAGSAAGLLLFDDAGRSCGMLAATAALVALVAGAAYAADDNRAEAAATIAIGAALAGFSLGLSAASGAYRTTLAAWFAATTAAERDAPVELTGVLREDAALTGFGASITLDVQSLRPLDLPHPLVRRGGVRLAVLGSVTPERILAWRAGRVVTVPALLRLPTTYRDPGLADEARALARRGVALVGTVKSAALVDVRARGGPTAEAAAAVRAWTRVQLARYIGRWGGPSGPVTTAILIGDRTGLDDEDERRLQRAGTYHVIAISGGNIAILAALLLGMLSAARVPSRIAAAIAIAVLLFYGVVAGAGASVARAVAAAVIYLGARVLDHRGPPINALAVAATGAVAMSGLAVLDAGFILSFGATLGILLGAQRLLAGVAGDGWRARVRRDAIALFIATACAEAVLAPAGAVIFSRITFAGLLLNFIAIPLMTVVQAGGIATLAAAPFWPAGAAAAGYVTHLAALGLVRSARYVDVAPWMSQEVPAPAWWLIALYYTACAALVWVPRLRLRALVVAGACVVAMVASPPVLTRRDAPAPPSGALRVVFLDVGQGDATVLILPNRRVLVVDAGGASPGGFDLGARVVAPAMRNLGARTLRSLVITHADPDHVGGAASIARSFRPSAVWEGVPVPPDRPMQELAALAAGLGSTWRAVQVGDVEREGAVTIRVLHPPLPDWERQRVRNDDSVVLDVRLGDVSVVLPGDVERGGEQILVPHLGELAPLVVLKAPHHGSATSSTSPLLAAIRPAAVIYSAGRDNRFGHPHPAVVERYARAGAVAFATARDGAVILDTDGRSVEISGWASGRGVVIDANRRQPRSR